MVAPNGARRTRNDHPAIPVTNAQIIETARACFAAGADGIHAHIRDDTERHLLDTAQYRDLVDGLHDAVPDMYVQVTSEAAGRYDATAQQDLIRELVPEHVSVAMREMVRSEEDWPAARDFYHWADEASVSIQHIVYSTSELARFIAACDAGHIPQGLLSIQLVLGTYDGTEISTPDAIQSFVDLITGSDYEFDWMQFVVEPRRLGRLRQYRARRRTGSSKWCPLTASGLPRYIWRDRRNRRQEISKSLR